MIPETILYTLLTADAAVTGLVADRVYPGRLPLGKVPPAIVYRRIDVVQLHRPVAPTAQGYYLCRARMRVGVLTPVGTGYVIAQTLLQRVRAVCGNKVGVIAGYAGTVIGAPLVAPEEPEDETGVAIDTVDFMVTYREPVNA